MSQQNGHGNRGGNSSSQRSSRGYSSLICTELDGDSVDEESGNTDIEDAKNDQGV